MTLKTVLHRLANFVPTSAEYRREQLRAAAQVAQEVNGAPTATLMPVAERADDSHIHDAEVVDERRRPEPDPVLRHDGQPVPQIRRGDVEGIRKAITARFEEIGVDGDECAVYIYKLANAEEGAELTERQLRFVLDSLYDDDVRDVEGLQRLCSPEDNT